MSLQLKQVSCLFGTIHVTRHIATSQVYYDYRGTWNNTVRLQNPEIVKNIPTYEFVREDGKFKKTQMIMACGLGSTGSLGIAKYYKPEKKSLEDMRPKDTAGAMFKRINTFTREDKIYDISCGYGFTVVAAKLPDSSHTAVGFGLNTHSQIGYHAPRKGFPLEIVATPSPIFLPTKSPVKKVACGRSHSILFTEAGQVFSLGNNSLGQCGRPIVDKEVYFGSKYVHQIQDLPLNIKQLECGQDHSMFLTESGELYACGWGADGQTGLNHFNNEHLPTRVKGDIEGVNIIKVSSCADTVLALDDNGNLFGWGNSEYAQFRDLTGDESEQFNSPRHLEMVNVPGKIIDIAAGGTVCAILNDKGQVFVWGFGILGKGPEVDHLGRPSLLPETLFGMNVYNPDTKVIKIYAGLSHFAAITNKGDLYTWGRNRGSSLGFQHQQNQFFPMRVNMNLAEVNRVALGVDHTVALVEKVC